MITKEYLQKTKKKRENFFDILVTFLLYDILVHKILCVKFLATTESYLKTDENTRSRILDIIQSEEMKMYHESNIAIWKKSTNLTKSNIQAYIKVSVVL